MCQRHKKVERIGTGAVFKLEKYENLVISRALQKQEHLCNHNPVKHYSNPRIQNPEEKIFVYSGNYSRSNECRYSLFFAFKIQALFLNFRNSLSQIE